MAAATTSMNCSCRPSGHSAESRTTMLAAGVRAWEADSTRAAAYILVAAGDTARAWAMARALARCASDHPRQPAFRIRYVVAMTPPSSAQQHAWMAQWRSAAVALARVGQSELMHVDLWRVAADLEDACVSSARAAAMTSASSGLVEQQRWLHRRARS